jgi:eukaryotic-like serine/threonine-protein kinase
MRSMGDRTSAARADQLAAGVVIAGRYQLVAQSGQGAMGSVWAAKHVALGNTVAIKFLHPEMAASKDARARFAREAKIAAMLGERCRYIARVTDYGVLEHVGPFLVMEYLHGEELSQKMRRDRRIHLHEAAQILTQLCRALDVAHAAGVVHRDIKPANVFLAKPHTNMSVFVKLMDFGVAKLLDHAIEQQGPRYATRVGSVIGTPAYMSPEQLLAQQIDHRSDLWGVAAMTYRLLTGEFPFGNGTLAEMGVRIVTVMPKPPSQLVPELPRALDAWFERALAKSPENRFSSASELARAFAAAAEIEPFPLMSRTQFTTPMPSSAPTLPESGIRRAAEPATVRALSRSMSGLRRVRKRRNPLGWIVALLFMVAAGVLLYHAGFRVDSSGITLPTWK